MVDDLARTIELVEKLSHADKRFFKEVTSANERISKDPSSVLGSEIPPPPKDSYSISHNLPIPDFDETGYVGRKEIAEQLVSACSGPYPVITIVGEGGLGKTSLALKVAYDLLDSKQTDFDAIAWTTCKTSQLTAHEVVRIDDAIKDSLGMFLDVATKLAGDDLKITDPIEEILSYLKTFKILLVIDNLETVLDDRIREFIRQIPHGSKVLLTSRIGLGQYEYPFKLEEMKEGEAVQLIRALSKVRGVQRLVRMSNADLGKLCARMKYNPGWIKWFVAASQTGKRPEDTLNNPKLFLDFCMSNVYEFLTPESKHVLKIMTAAAEQYSHANLAYLADINPTELPKALQQLLSTNMVNMVSVPSGSSYFSLYEVSELARAYLRSHHPVDARTLQSLTKRKKHLIATEQQLAGLQRLHPYDIRAIHMRSRGDIVPAKYLKDALDLAEKKNFDAALKLCQAAQSVAPDYYEANRIEGYIHSLHGNDSLARAAYEKATEMEPGLAKPRIFYAGCLLKIGDAHGAYEQYLKAETIDPEDHVIQLEKARSLLFLYRFEEAKDILEKLARRDGLSQRSRLKITDTYLQYVYRKAEYFVAAQEYAQAKALLFDFETAYRNAPKELIDEKTRSRLIKASLVAIACMKHEPDFTERKKLIELFLSFQANAGVVPSVITRKDEKSGHVAFLARNGKELQIGRNDFLKQDDWQKAKVGQYLYYCISIGDTGRAIGATVV